MEFEQITMATPDHMKGINSLPSVQAYNDAVARARATPTSSWEEARARGKQTEALRMKAMADKNALNPSRGVFGREGTLSKQIDKQLAGFEKDRQKAANAAVANAAPKHARLIADLDSECFEKVTWKDDVLTCTFWRGGQLVYDYFDQTRDDFVDMVSSGSLGKFFNDNIR
jgi:hypothetical protein